MHDAAVVWQPWPDRRHGHRAHDTFDRLGFTWTGDQLGYRGSTPGVFRPLARRCQPQHDPPHNFLLLGAESGVDRVSTFGKCAMDTAKFSRFAGTNRSAKSSWSHTFNGINQKLKAARIFDAFPEINPCAGT